MKKLLFFLMTITASLSVYAQEPNEININNEIIISNTPLYTSLGTVNVNYESLIFPWTFSVPAPVEDVDEIDGPCGPNTSTWMKQNGYLYITILEKAEPQIWQGETYEFIVKTKEATYYSITLNIN